MRILVINSGSSTIKYALFDRGKSDPLMKGVVERIGAQEYRSAMEALFDRMNQSKIDAVGHRVVHGGEGLKKPTRINADVIEQIKEASKFVPLHSAPNLIGIAVAQEKIPAAAQVAVFDTAAYSMLADRAFLYGIPLEFYEKHHIRRYGFHGINHTYVMQEATKRLDKENLKIITCHLGSGCSITAFENGIAQDTSMGLTPLEGVMMGTRSGDIDPSIVLYLIDVLGFSTEEVTDLLNKKSGLVGLGGKNDMRDIHVLAQSGDKQAQIALEVFIYRIQKYIGSYIAVLNGVDAIVFTGGIGEHDPYVRERIMEKFSYVGAFVEKEKNQKHEFIFSAAHSKVVLLNIAANEERAIAEQTEQLLR